MGDTSAAGAQTRVSVTRRDPAGDDLALAGQPSDRDALTMNLKAGFSKFLSTEPERLHFAAHSHHAWPDVTADAHAQSWRDAATHWDDKWEGIIADVVPAVQGHIARTLALSDPSAIAFAPNTHEFLVRILSCLDVSRPPSVLTTDAEFHSFRRQTERLAEEGLVELDIVPAEPFDTFSERFAERAAAGAHDLVFMSHVFFSSGFVVDDLAGIVDAVARDDAFVVIDGYHGFMAVPTDLSALESRVFYTAGGYKYAMSGEGVCFLHCPPGFGRRPRNTGWFASFGTLTESCPGEITPYAVDGMRFFGATFDPTAFYRLRAVMDWLEREGVSVADIHAYVGGLQRRMLTALEGIAHPDVALANLVPGLDARDRGHFLTFRTPRAATLYEVLRDANVVTDVRLDRLRFGFGVYQDEADVDELLRRLALL